MKISRFLRKPIEKDLKHKMVLIGGPRQVGKTTLAKSFLKDKSLYLNWDYQEDRDIIKSHRIPSGIKLLILDEVHKYPRWRGLIKGFYDKWGDQLSIVVTGSARIDHFRKGGDSLVGRYHYYRLHPFCLHEIDTQFLRSTTERLMTFGGFPEPYTQQDETEARRWRKQRLSRVVYQDLRDLETINDLGKMELLVDGLPPRVSSPLSLRNLGEDLEVSPNTVKRWIEVLEKVYYCYSVFPYGPPKIRAVKKTPKIYLWDWAEVEDKGARFENLVASHLLNFCHYQEDLLGHKMELRYLKDTDSREVDFVILKNKKPLFAVECKTGEKQISKHIRYFKERTVIPQYYQVHLGTSDYEEPGIRVLPFEAFCKKLLEARSK